MKLVKGIDSKGHRLYELTRQDLSYLVDHEYQVGNILIFSSAEKPRIGREIGRANTLRAAKSFLADLEQLDLSFPLWVPKNVDGVRLTGEDLGVDGVRLTGEALDSSPGSSLDESLISCPDNSLCESRGESLDSSLGSGLGDLGKTAPSAARPQELLSRIDQLAGENAELRAALAEKSRRVEELSFRSLQDELQHQELMQSLTSDSSGAVLDAIAELDELRVEALTLRKGLSLAEGRCAELESANVLLAAEQTTLLCELDAVQKALDAGSRLQGLGGHNPVASDQPSDFGSPGSYISGQSLFASGQHTGIGGSSPDPYTSGQHPDLGWQSQDGDQELVLTNPKGDVIHIYHEFPEIPRSSLRRKLFSRARQLLFVLAGMAVAIYVFYLNSVLDTMRASGVDTAPYSKAVLDALLRPFGF